MYPLAITIICHNDLKYCSDINIKHKNLTEYDSEQKSRHSCQSFSNCNIILHLIDILLLYYVKYS